MIRVIRALIGIVVGWLLSMFSDPAKERLWGPRLSLRFNPTSPVDSHMTPAFTNTGGSFPSFWLRIRVLNGGHSVARDVEVIARRLSRLGDDGRYTDLPNFGSLNLNWSYVGTPAMERIPTRIDRLCDVFYIPWPHVADEIHDDDAPPPRPFAHLALVAHSAAQPGVLGTGTYRLELVGTAANSRQVVRTLVFTVPQEWNGNGQAVAGAIDANLLPPFP